ncbi:MAG: putative PEP-CTERM system TPR-repeat lipoprotein [Bacteroidia bacterium]|jgi:putative PEP-CTERM system TPR-repeat lipoprotein
MKSVQWLFLTLLTLGLTLQGCGGDDRTSEEHITDAMAFNELGQYDAAVLELKSALTKSPGNMQARWVLGTIYLKTGETSAAVKELQRSLELGQDQETVLIPLATALLYEREYYQLLDQTADMANLTGDAQVRLLVLRGHANIGLNKLSEADGLYDLALGLRNADAEARLGKARVQATQGRMEKAREWIAAAVESDPALSLAWCLLGDIEQFEGNLKAAEAAYNKAIEARPDGIQELSGRALVRLSMGIIGKAAADVGKARRLSNMSRTKQPLFYYAIGQLELEREKYAQAAKAFEILLKFEPDYLPAHYYLATANYRQGKIEQAGQGATMFRKRAPQFTGGHRLYAAIKYTQGQYAQAQEALEYLLSFLPEDAWSQAMLADIAVLQGNPGQSVEDDKRIVELHPDAVEAHRKLALGLMLIDAGQASQ